MGSLPPAHDFLPVPSPVTPFWTRDKDDFADHRSTPELPEHADIVIIGGGYAGTATAWHLIHDRDASKPKQSIALLEARAVCEGATGRNGGHVRPDLYGHIPNYIQREGLAAGAELAEFELAHVQALRDVIVKEQIDCDFVLHRTVDVWCNEDGAAGAKQVYDRMCAHSLSYMRDVFFKHGGEAEALSGVKGAKAMASFTAASLWPYKFITHLLKKMAASGDVNLQTHAPVTRVVPDEKGGFVVETPRGSMHAGRVVHANNAFVAGLLPEYKQSIVPCKGICCRITVPEGTVAPHLPNSYIVRDEDKTLSYLVSRTDGSIVVGGAATRFRPHRSQWYDNIDDRVLPSGGDEYYDGYMQRTFRGWEDSGAQVDQIWTGVMGYSYDSLSHVGEVPGRRQQYIVAGFNGHGMPVIWLAAKGLAQMINEGVEFEKTGVPRVMKTTQARIDRARSGKEEYGDILGDGSLAAEGPKMAIRAKLD